MSINNIKAIVIEVLLDLNVISEESVPENLIPYVPKIDIVAENPIVIE